jgi:hypothetical protein
MTGIVVIIDYHHPLLRGSAATRIKSSPSMLSTIRPVFHKPTVASRLLSTLSESTPEALKSFPVLLLIPVAWGHMDAYAYVNNCQYFQYFESTRMSHFGRIGEVLSRNGHSKYFEKFVS